LAAEAIFPNASDPSSSLRCPFFADHVRLPGKHLQSRTVAAPVIDGLLFNENRVVPQLAETAAWVAGMNPEIFQKIMETDPSCS
jgi:hypothetical protein